MPEQGDPKVFYKVGAPLKGKLFVCIYNLSLNLKSIYFILISKIFLVLSLEGLQSLYF